MVKKPAECPLGGEDKLNTSAEKKPIEPPKPPPPPPNLIYRSTDCVKLIESLTSDTTICDKEHVLEASEDRANRVDAVCCSEDGQIIAWCNNKAIKCINTNTRQVIFDQPNTSKSNYVYISPKSTRLVSYSTQCAKENLHFWDIQTQTQLASITNKKTSQWKPIFSTNEDICLQHVNSELHLFSGGKFDQPKQRISHIKIDGFSLSTAAAQTSSYQNIYVKRMKNKTHYIATYTRGSKGQPSIVKIYKYPNMNDSVANKSFFRADRVEFNWSPSGNSLLLVCIADIDRTGKSYYGEQSLNFMDVKGDSYNVSLPKEGAIFNIEWYPSCDKDMFVCVYGQVPSKVTLFNNKCESMFHFEVDQGVFNTTSFNPFGNLLAVYGIGNLSGQLCIWDFEKRKVISTLKIPETTVFEWCPDGKHILTGTTRPRLNVSNGFRIWHYTGSLLYELVNQDGKDDLELYDIMWQRAPGTFPKPKCDSKPSKLPNLIEHSRMGKFQKAAAKYVPPSARNATAPSSVSFIDSAIGRGANNRLIVGLDSLNLNKKKTNPSKRKKKPASDVTNNEKPAAKQDKPATPAKV